MKRFDTIKKGILTLFMIIPFDKVRQTIKEISIFIERLHKLQASLNEKAHVSKKKKKNVKFIRNNLNPDNNKDNKTDGSI